MTPNEDPETLERRSESIRADVDETLSELQRKISPEALVDRSMHLLRDHGGDMAKNVLQTVSRNPVPALLIAAGAVWMVAAQLQSSSPRGGDSYPDEDAQGDGPLGTVYADVEAADGADTAAADDTGGASSGLSGVRAKVQNAAHAASATVGERTRKVKERSREIVHGAREKSRHAGEDMARLLREQPLVVGAAGILAGALIGALLPETAQENRLLGEARDRTLRKARSAGEQGLERVEEKVEDAMDRTAESIRSDGAAPMA